MTDLCVVCEHQPATVFLPTADMWSWTQFCRPCWGDLWVWIQALASVDPESPEASVYREATS